MEIQKDEIELKNNEEINSNLEEMKEGIWRTKERAMRVSITIITIPFSFAACLEVLLPLSKIRHERILSLIGVCNLGKDERGNNKVAIISEYKDRAVGTVYSHFHGKQSNFTNFGKLKILHQTAEFLLFLQSLGLSHFRVNSRNILMDGELNVWLNISTLGIDVGNINLTNCYYHSPEYIFDLLSIDQNINNNRNYPPVNLQKYQFFDDVYSFGIFIYELLAHRIPFSRLFQSAASGGKEMVGEFAKEVQLGRIRPTFPPDIDRSLLPLVQLCSDCWISPPSNRVTVEGVLNRLTATYASIVFDNEISRNFWLSSFPYSLTGSVSEITDMIFKFVKIEVNHSDLEYLSLKAAFANLFSLPLSGVEKSVKMRDLVSALEYIGPISRTMISSISALLQKTWFHGLLGREDADKLIGDQPVGTFLFRWSKSEVGCYSLTVKNAQEIKHFRIAHSLGSSFILGSVEYESLDEILMRYKKELYLKIPCPNSLFKQFMTSAELQSSDHDLLINQAPSAPENRYFSVDEILS